MKIFKRKIKLLFILSLLITLPVSIFFSIWIGKTFTTYFALDHYKEPLTIIKGTRLYDIGIYEFVDLKNKLQSKFLNQEFEDVNLYLPSSSINQLTENLPKSGENSVKSTMIIDQTVIPGKSRFRGDNNFHWLLPYKSWRFKTKKNNLYNKVRKYNLIIAKSDGLIANHISYKLAKELHLLAPNSDMINLNVNNSSNGLKIMVEQIDESFLRNNGRMPNDIYKGDNIGSKFNLGISVPTMFTKPSLWNKTAYNNHYNKESRKPLETLFQNLVNDEHNLLDKKSFVNLMLYIDLTSSYHHDNQHNWILYYDNYYEKFYPIMWDTMGWQPSWMAKKSIHLMHSSELMKSLYRNYDFMKEKYFRLMAFSLEDRIDFFTTLDKEVQKVTEKIKRLKYTFTPDGKYRDSEKTLKALKSLRERVIDRINYVEKELLGDANISNYKYSDLNNGIRLSIDGNKLVTRVKLQVKDIETLGNAYIAYYVNSIERKKKIDYTVNRKDKSIEFTIPLLAKTNEILGKPYPGASSIEFSNATYDITIENLEKVHSVSIENLNKKHNILTIPKENHILSTSFDNQFNIISQHTEQKTEIWSGTKIFSGFTIIKNNVILEKGTHIIFDNNATLKILGKVTAIGTKEDPIIFAAKDKIKPWNTFALKDEKANGSVFKYCIFKDGSGDKGDLYEYTAMLSVHNVKDLLVEDCEFYDSKRTDDMVHVIYSDATFKNTKFVRSLSDALDVDISNLVVDNCEFIDSGNDSIDLMTTNAVVINTKFTNSKDKGISIGEGSNLLAVNNYITGSEIGMQSKDTSQAYIYNTSFIGNKKAIDAYHKNWRYSEGGTIILDQCIFEKNIVNATVGKKSKVIINSSNIDTPDKFDTKSLKKKKIIISDDGPIKYDLKEPLFKDKTHLISKNRRGYHE